LVLCVLHAFLTPLPCPSDPFLKLYLPI
jgi:hypothetical protein